MFTKGFEKVAGSRYAKELAKKIGLSRTALKKSHLKPHHKVPEYDSKIYKFRKSLKENK